MINHIHENSLRSYRELKKEDRFSAILKAFNTFKEPLSDRDVKRMLGFEDMNSVRPRITELIKQGKLKECGCETDLFTQKSVRLCRLTTPEDIKQESFL